MSLRLYLDECAYSKRLVYLLRNAPYEHYVETPVDSRLIGRADAEHLAYASQHGLVLVTKDPYDFEAFHHQHPGHSGILAICHRNRPSELSDPEVARAIQNVIDAKVPIAGVFQSLNAWNW